MRLSEPPRRPPPLGSWLLALLAALAGYARGRQASPCHCQAGPVVGSSRYPSLAPWAMPANVPQPTPAAAAGLLFLFLLCHAGGYRAVVQAAAPSGSSSGGGGSLRNVLLITVDDLRPQLHEAYGMTETVTPNLDRFASESVTFQRAYCQFAVCSPSRNSFMSGRRPDTTKVWNFINRKCWLSPWVICGLVQARPSLIPVALGPCSSPRILHGADFAADFREKGVGSHWISMPQYFKNRGYLTFASGKL
jgi:hypothetical protein